MRLNVTPKVPRPATHEGGPAARITPLQMLRRSVLSCLLWEDEFYESGQAIADRISSLCELVTAEQIATLAIQARADHHLRHVPLLLLDALTKHKGALVGDAIAGTIARPDELAEFLSVYWRKGRHPLSKQVKRGLAKAFLRFDGYQLAKYNRDGAVKLRDVLFLCHAKPDTEERAELWKQLVAGTLPAPDTWEVSLSAGADKKETFERLIAERKLGYLALLRNLRNMVEAGVDRSMIMGALLELRGADRVLPFRFTAAARACPSLEPMIDAALVERIGLESPFDGVTFVLVDVSGSMDKKLSGKSDLTRMDAAATLASVIPGDRRVFSFSDETKEVPARLGMAGVDAIIGSQEHGGTYLGNAMGQVNNLMTAGDRLIVITDEQSADEVPAPVAERAYMINVASARNGVGYGHRWTHIDGFSESVLRWIREVERAA